MAAAVTHPDLHDDSESRPVTVDAAQYYGGQEFQGRSRTYSAVCGIRISCAGNSA